MNVLAELLNSPDLYPWKLNLKRQIMGFVRMSRATYHSSIFLDSRTQSLDDRVYELRLDDVLLACGNSLATRTDVHYILHTTFCCSTLLARYFEGVASSLVLKEPLLLTQLALLPEAEIENWREIFNLVIRLLTRSYDPNGLVVIKAHEPCNYLAWKLLDRNPEATVTFLITPLRSFLLSVLKSPERRRWVRTRLPDAAIAANCEPLIDRKPSELSDAQAAAFLWLVNRYICGRLTSGADRSRFHVLNGDYLANSPDQAVAQVARNCCIRRDSAKLKSFLQQPRIDRYSKDLSRSYSSFSRERELAELEANWGREAEEGEEWAASIKLDQDLESLSCN